MDSDNENFKVPDPDDAKDVDKDAETARIQDEYERYKQAFEEEWKNLEDPDKELTPDEIRARTRDNLTSGVPDAVTKIIYLSQHAKSESLQFKASAYIIDKAEEAGLVGDPLEELLRGIRK